MISLEVKGNDTALAFAELDRRLTDLSPIMAQIAEFLLDTTLARFQEGVAPDGSPWAPKSPSTIAAYQARKQAISYRPLIGPTKSLSAATNFATASGQDWARISSRAIQSAVMQFGAKQGALGTNKAGRLRERSGRYHHNRRADDWRPSALSLRHTDGEAITAAVT